jgi:hypothetical protein
MDALTIYGNAPAQNLTDSDIVFAYNSGAGRNCSEYAPTPPAPTISVNLTSPVDAYNSTTTTIDFSYVLGTSGTANCTLLINGTANETATGLSSGSQTFSSVEIAEGVWNWAVNCTDEYDSEETATRVFTVTVPVVETPSLATDSVAGFFVTLMMVSILVSILGVVARPFLKQTGKTDLLYAIDKVIIIAGILAILTGVLAAII